VRHPAILALADGTVFRGTAIGAPGKTVGEVVFNTALTGYQEILTDPSYHRQIVTLTYPHIGNTGINPEDEEANGVYAAGLVIRDLPLVESNWRAREPLENYLERHNRVGLCGIDTRKLTRILRERGAQNGCIIANPDCCADLQEEEAVAMARAFAGLQGMDLAKEVSVEAAYPWQQGNWHWTAAGGEFGTTQGPWRVVVYDYGVKRTILRMLAQRGCQLTVVPATTPAAEVLALNPHGVLLSNGPGDPQPCQYAINAIRELAAAGMPLFGICLGHQLLSLASGAQTVKMKFGHHGANHPVQDVRTGEVFITSQNHGFAVDEASLPATLRPTHRSLFDGSLQGVERTDIPAFGFQGHPEASPGPHDIAPLFDRFIAMFRSAA